MAKDKVTHVRSARPKNAKQLAKAAANVAAHQARTERLQAISKAKADQRKQIADDYVRNVLRGKFEREYVEAALKGPHAYILNRWLVNRVATFERVSRFFQERPLLIEPKQKQAA